MKRIPLIIVVDDDPEDLVLFQMALKELDSKFPVELITAESGSVLLNTLNDWFRNHHPPPDLILFDLNMPVMDGMQVLRNLKSDLRFRSIPIVAFTTSSDQASVDSCYELGANAFMTKPASLEELVEMVSMIVNFWCFSVKLPGWGPHRSM